MIITRVVRRLITVSALLVGSAAIGAATSMHLELNSAEPKVNGTVTASPKELKLWFTEPVTAPATTIRVTNAENAALKLGPVSVAEPPLSPAIVKVLDSLHAGTYTVTWRTKGDDGHAATGKYKFTVK